MPFLQMPDHTDTNGCTWLGCVVTWDTTPEEDDYIKNVLHCGPQV